MTDVDIVIVNYKSALHTVKCVASAVRVAKADGVAAQVIVVDNGDDDASLGVRVQDDFGATYIEATHNLGFGAASNLGAEAGSAPCILFLNPDAQLHEGALGAFLAFFRNPENSSYGIVGPEICDPKGVAVPSCSKLPGLVDLVSRTAGVHRVPGSAGGYPYLSLADHAASRPVGQVMGAALAIRRDVFEKLYGFDKRFFLYYEDVDLSARAAAMGAHSYYLKDACVTHVGRVSSSQDAGVTLALHIRSRLIYARLHHGLSGQIILLMVCAVIEFPARMLRAMLGRNSPKVDAVFRAYKLLVFDLFSGTALPASESGTQSQR